MILCVDGSHMLHRQKHATDTPDWRMYSFMFMRTLIVSCEKYHPEDVFVLWDKGVIVNGVRSSSTRRATLFQDYKKDRYSDDGEMDDALKAYVEARKFLHEILPSLGIRSILIPGQEADDLAQLVMKYTDGGVHVTEDRDWFLNINGAWSQYRPVADEEWTFKDLEDLFGSPNTLELCWIMKALMGKGSDIPGIYGVGDVTARRFAKILLQYPDDGYQRLGDSVVGQRVRENESVVRMNMELFATWYVRSDPLANVQFLDQARKFDKPSHFSWLKMAKKLDSNTLPDWYPRWEVIMRRLRRREL